MPYITLTLPPGFLPADEPARRDALARRITTIAAEAEQLGDAPQQQFLTWVQFIDPVPGSLYAGGQPATGMAWPVVLHWRLPQGVLTDEARRACAIQQLHDALADAKAPQDPRPLLSSVILDEVPDGQWGANGQLWRLPDFARAAGFRHLRHLCA